MNESLLKNNNECMEKIDEKYLNVLNSIVSYVRIQLAEKESEEAINDILDMFLEAQENGKDLNELVGDDFQKFADEFINSYKYGEKFYFFKRVKKTIIDVLKVAPIFYIIDIIGRAPYEGNNILSLSNYSYKVTLMHIILLLAMITISYTINYLQGMEEVIDKKLNRKGSAISLSFIAIIMYCIFASIGDKFAHVDIISIPNYLICYIVAIIIAVIYICVVIKKIYDYRKKYVAYMNGGADNE